MFPVQKPEVSENIAVSSILENGLVMFQGAKFAELAVLLGACRAVGILHQTHHWQTSGPAFYGDHLMFERLYGTTVPEIDLVAEKLLGLSSGEELVSPSKQVINLSHFLKTHKNHSQSDLLPRRSLEAEVLFVGLVEAIMDKLKAANLLTRGLEQMLGTIADTHEGNIYLLKQRVKSV
jgi:DNA-binding ferritin-like protein